MRKKNNIGVYVFLMILCLLTTTVVILNALVPSVHNVLVEIGNFFTKLWTDFINLFKK